MNSAVLIWWLDDYLIGVIEANFANHDLPTYVRSELQMLKGRSGRFKLWISNSEFTENRDSFKLQGIGQHATAIGSRLGVGPGGIVIRKTDYDSIKDLPGQVTDLKLDVVSSQN